MSTGTMWMTLTDLSKVTSHFNSFSIYLQYYSTYTYGITKTYGVYLLFLLVQGHSRSRE